MKREPEDRLTRAARAALERAYAPYSGFRVGAAVEAASGDVFAGCNVENASYGLTICAERVAAAGAVAAGHRRLRRMAVVAETERAVAPCGACCQFVAEFGADVEVVGVGRGETVRWRLRDLLPRAFRLRGAGGGAEAGGGKAALAGGKAALAACAVLLAGCAERLPTVESEDLVQSGVAVQVTLPARDFLRGAEVYGGYGRPSELGSGFIAHRFGASGGGGSGSPGEPGLEAATLLRFGAYPAVVTVNDTAGTSRPDSSLTFISGRLVAHFDTLGSVLDGPVEIAAHALAEPWDAATATWDLAVDTLAHQEPWSAPGGGAFEPVGAAAWDPAETDSVVIQIDSARVAAWGDSADFSRGARLATAAEGVRLQLRRARLWLHTRPSLNPDTIIDVLAGTQHTTFIYHPVPGPPDEGLRVGGAPAWRTVLDLSIPSSLSGPPGLCARLECPVALHADHVSYAALRLHTRRGLAAFAPSDTISIDLRMVTAPAALPKSPLGPSTTGPAGVILAPEWFAPPAGHGVEVPVTGMVRDFLRGEDGGGPAGETFSGTVALLSTFEPLSIEYAAFEGLGAASGAPELRLILNFARAGS